MGQPNMTSGASNSGGAVSASGFEGPGVFSDGTHLFVTDFANRRTLIFNSLPTANNPSADVVLGQANMTSNGVAGPTASTLGLSWGVSVSSAGKLSITDIDNYRVLIWNSIPTTNGVAADIVVGQADLTSSIDATSASGLKVPYVGAFLGEKFYVVDRDNHRILIWNSVPTANGVAADSVLGQANFTSNTINSGGLSATSLNAPTDIR